MYFANQFGFWSMTVMFEFLWQNLLAQILQYLVYKFHLMSLQHDYKHLSGIHLDLSDIKWSLKF